MFIAKMVSNRFSVPAGRFIRVRILSDNVIALFTLANESLGLATFDDIETL